VAIAKQVVVGSCLCSEVSGKPGVVFFLLDWMKIFCHRADLDPLGDLLVDPWRRAWRLELGDWQAEGLGLATSVRPAPAYFRKASCHDFPCSSHGTKRKQRTKGTWPVGRYNTDSQQHQHCQNRSAVVLPKLRWFSAPNWPTPLLSGQFVLVSTATGHLRRNPGIVAIKIDKSRPLGRPPEPTGIGRRGRLPPPCHDPKTAKSWGMESVWPSEKSALARDRGPPSQPLPSVGLASCHGIKCTRPHALLDFPKSRLRKSQLRPTAS